MRSLAHPNTEPGDSSEVYMQAPFPPWVPPGEICQLAQVTNSWASSCPVLKIVLQKQPDGQGRLMDSSPQARIAKVDVDGLCG